MSTPTAVAVPAIAVSVASVVTPQPSNELRRATRVDVLLATVVAVPWTMRPRGPATLPLPLLKLRTIVLCPPSPVGSETY